MALSINPVGHMIFFLMEKRKQLQFLKSIAAVVKEDANSLRSRHRIQKYIQNH